jgi:hypothetical protein
MTKIINKTNHNSLVLLLGACSLEADCSDGFCVAYFFGSGCLAYYFGFWSSSGMIELTEILAFLLNFLLD